MTIELIFCPDPRLYFAGYLASVEDLLEEYPEHVPAILDAIRRRESLRIVCAF